MNSVLEIQFSGWTRTPRMPFVLSGNAICLPVPTYSLLLGLVGCCLGRNVEANEVAIGFRYSFDTVAMDLETRQRLEFDGKRIKPHAKGTDAYSREFHVLPRLTIWLNRVDWIEYFKYPIGTPVLGRSQDILKIESVNQVLVEVISQAKLSGCMLPFLDTQNVGGQLVQLVEAYQENETVGSGRKPIKTNIFIAISGDNEQIVSCSNLYRTLSPISQDFYMHKF